MCNRRRLGIIALVTLALAVGCGSSGDTDSSSGGNDSDPAPEASPSSSAETTSGADPAAGSTGESTGGSVTVVLDGVTYQFAGSSRYCREVSGGLVVSLALTQIDGNPAPDDAGYFDMSMYPEGLEDESSISVDLPDGSFNAGDNDIGQDTEPVSLDRDGLNATGPQTLSTHSGEQSDATIRVECA